MNNIEWKHIFKNNKSKQTEYYISNTGLLKSIYKSGKTKISSGHNVNCNCENQYYKKCSLGYIHRLVAEAFVPNPLGLTEVDHIDGNPSNNNAKNLRWVTHKDNMNNRVTKGRIAKHINLKYGRKHKKIHFVIRWQQLDDTGNIVREWDSLIDAAKALNTTRSNLWNSSKLGCKGKGFHWKKILKKTVSFSRRP